MINLWLMSTAMASPKSTSGTSWVIRCFVRLHRQTLPFRPGPLSTRWPVGLREEGLAAADLDGDGRLELIAGQSWYRPPERPGEAWRRYPFAKDFLSPRVVVADFEQ